MKNRPITFIHIFAFFVFIGFNFFILYRQSRLDLFDFFVVIHETANIFNFIMLIIMFASLITLFSLFYKFNLVDKIERSKAQENRERLDNKLNNLLSKVSNLELLIKNEVVNNKSLKEKLINVIKSINFDDNFERNAIFNSIFEKVAIKVSDTYTLFKKDKKSIDYFEIKIIQTDLKNILSANPNFKINVNSIIELSNELLKDFSIKYSSAKNETSKDNDFTKKLILNYFKVLVESAYNDYCKNGIKPEIEKEYSEIKKNNSSEINGNDNLNLQDNQAETINININKNK